MDARVRSRDGDVALLLLDERHRMLRDSDDQLWHDLHADLRDSEVKLLPLHALPAA